MKTVRIAEPFSGYPKNDTDVVAFAAGEEVEVSDAFADIIVGKGHATLVTKPADKAEKKDASA